MSLRIFASLQESRQIEKEEEREQQKKGFKRLQINKNYFMREMLVLMMLIFEVVGCSDIRTNKHIRVDSAKTEPDSLNTDTQENFPKKFPVAAVKINFLGIAKDAEESWFGNLQGVQVSDSSGPYVFKQFISDTLSFQLIFYPKRFKKKRG